MNIEKISDLIQDDFNANKGRAIGKEKLKTSIETNGFGRSVLIDKNGKLIAGNKTVEQALELGLTELIIVRTNGEQLVAVQREDLDLDTKEGRNLAIADNRVSEANLSWDIDNLRRISETFGQEILTDYFYADELEILSNSFKEIKKQDESNMEGSAERYKSNSILNIVLYFEARHHQEVLMLFDAVCEQMDNFDKSEVVKELIAYYKLANKPEHENS